MSSSDHISSNPLFAAEGMDLEAGKKVLTEMEQALYSLERILSHGSWLRRLFFVIFPLKYYAVPLPFLWAFIRSEEMRRAGAKELVSQWKYTAKLYLKSAKKFRTLHRILFVLERPTNFKFQDMFGNISSLDDVRVVLDRLVENGKKLYDEVELRSVDERTFPTLSIDPAQMSAQEEKMLALALKYSTPFHKTEVVERYGPFQYTLSNFDGTPTAHRFMWYKLREPNGLESVYVALLDRYLFLYITDGAVGKRGFGTSALRLLIEHGVPYWYQPSTTFYTMRDQQYWASLVSAVDLKMRPELDVRLVQKQKSSSLHLLLMLALKDIYNYKAHSTERVHMPQDRKKYSLLFGLLMHDHPSIYFLPFNGSVWRTTPLSFNGIRRATKEQYPYEDGLKVGLGDQTLELVMRGARVREELRKARGYHEVPR